MWYSQSTCDQRLSQHFYTAQRFNVPLDLSAVPVIDNFLGRQHDLGRLWQYLQPTAFPRRKVAILHGLGGMGKTQLAIRFARDHKTNFTAVFWLSGKDQSTLLHSLSSAWSRIPGQPPDNRAIDDDKVEDRARCMLKWLAKDGNSHWLVIFDNIDQYSPGSSGSGDAFDIAKFFPTADHGSILITSRLPGLTELGKSFPIRKLDSTDAVQLLLQSSGLSANTIQELEKSPGERVFNI